MEEHSKRVLIIGAGGHAQVIADVLLRMREVGASVMRQAMLGGAEDLR